MNVDYLNISKYINDCPNCGSSLLGADYGYLKVDESTIKRTCRCGFKFHYVVCDGI